MQGPVSTDLPVLWALLCENHPRLRMCMTMTKALLIKFLVKERFQQESC